MRIHNDTGADGRVLGGGAETAALAEKFHEERREGVVDLDDLFVRADVHDPGKCFFDCQNLGSQSGGGRRGQGRNVRVLGKSG